MLLVLDFMDETMPAQILWIGSKSNGLETVEFAAIYDELSKQHVVHFASNLAEAKSTPTSNVVVVAPSRPGEFPARDVKELQASRPDSRFVYLLGDWCCGQKRTEPEFSRVETLYRHELQRGNVFSQLTGESAISHLSAGTFVAVYARTRSYGDAIQEMVASSASGVVQLKFGDIVTTSEVSVVIWETPMEGYHRESQLAEIKARHPAARVIALVTFPRGYEADDWIAAGVEVLSQPFREADLSRQIRKVSDSDQQRGLRISA